MSSTQLESRAGLYAPHRPMAQATPRIRVFVVHNHPVFRFGVVSVLEAEASVQCVGEAADLAEALHTAAVLAPDVVVLDRNMPDASDTDALNTLRAQLPQARLIVLASKFDPQASSNTPVLGAWRVLSLIPPMTQLNTPYPSTAYLTGFLRSARRATRCRTTWPWRWCCACSPAGRPCACPSCADDRNACPGRSRSARHGCTPSTAPVMRATPPPSRPRDRLPAGARPTLAHRIASRAFLPEGPRFASLDAYVDDDGGDPLAWAFGALGVQDRARHLATLYLNDLADVLRDAVDPRFEFVRYAEAWRRASPASTRWRRRWPRRPTWSTHAAAT
jgi:CheY-like chemotaxis protein